MHVEVYPFKNWCNFFLDPSYFRATYLMMHPGPEGELHKVARNYKQKLALMQLETVCQPTLHKKTRTQC